MNWTLPHLERSINALSSSECMNATSRENSVRASLCSFNEGRGGGVGVLGAFLLATRILPDRFAHRVVDSGSGSGV